MVNSEAGFLEIDIGSQLRGCCRQCIDAVVVQYLSGDCDNEFLFAQGVAGLLGRSLCCGQGHNELSYWQDNFVAKREDGRFTTTLSNEHRNNPFGTSRAGLELYNCLKPVRRLGGLLI